MGEAALIIPPHRRTGPNGITQRVASFQDFKGIAAPAVSLPGQARLYFDSAANKWKMSQNGSAYENFLSLPSFTANRVLHTNAAGTAVVEANNVNIFSTGELLVRRSTLLFAGNDVVGIDGANSNSIQRLFFRHPNAGTAARGVFDLVNDAGNTGGLSLTSTGFTPTSGINANELSIIGATTISSIGIITLGNDPVRVVTEGVERLNVLPSADNGALVIGSPFLPVGSELLRVNGLTRVERSSAIILELVDSRTSGVRGPHIDFRDGLGNLGFIAMLTGTTGIRQNAIEYRPPSGGRHNFYDGVGLAEPNLLASATPTHWESNGNKRYPDAAVDPTSPAPAEGDRYYNTALEMEMRFDGSRAKFLSVESLPIQFGRNGNTASGSFYRGINGLNFTASRGHTMKHNATVVGLSFSRSDSDSATFQVTANGTTVASAASVAVGGSDSTLNANVASGDKMAVRNGGPNTSSNVHGHFTLKWRV